MKMDFKWRPTLNCFSGSISLQGSSRHPLSAIFCLMNEKVMLKYQLWLNAVYIGRKTGFLKEPEFKMENPNMNEP